MSAILVKDHQLDRSIESKEPESASSSASAPFEKDARIYEYALAANPVLTPMPVAVHDASLHEHGSTRSSRLTILVPLLTFLPHF